MSVLEEALTSIAKRAESDLPIHPRPFNSADIEVLYAAAYGLYETGDCERAEPLFRQLVVSKPLDLRHWTGLGAVLQMQAKYDEALTAWSMAALVDTLDATPHFFAAECLLALGQADEALKAIAEADARTTESDPLAGKIEVLWQKLSEKSV